MGPGLLALGQALAPTAVNFLSGAAQNAAVDAMNRNANNQTTQNAQNTNYNANQTQGAVDRNVANTGNLTNQQLNRNEAMRRDGVQFDSRLGTQVMGDRGYIGNAAANADSSRQAALNAQSAINNVYQNAAGNLNNAMANSNQAINGASQAIAGLFR